MPRKIYEMFLLDEKTIIAFYTINSENLHKRFYPMDVVFSYSLKDAVNDGFLTPAMDTRALVPAFEVFTKQLLEHFGYINSSKRPNEQERKWDVVAEKNNQKIWVECKVYKSQVVSPSAANSMLQTVVMRKMEQNIPKEDIILLVVLSKIPSFQNDIIFERYGIVVWDIDNLVFYSKDYPTLLKQFYDIYYWSHIFDFEGRVFQEALFETNRILYRTSI